MANYEVLVTDVTCYGDLFCVAGWDRNRKQMVRPEPATANAAYEASRFWQNDLAGPGQVFAVGNVVKFDANAPPPNFAFPHATEDRVVVGGSWVEVIGGVQAADIPAAVAEGVSLSLSVAFDGGLTRLASGKAYVPRNYQGRSLGAIEIEPVAIDFYENAFQGNAPKLRAMISDGGLTYDLAVTADAARTRWQQGGLNALCADVEASELVHVRLGLSRPFPARPDECFAQINGLILL